MSKESEELMLLMEEYRQTMQEMAIECHNVNEEIDRWSEVRNVLAKPYQDILSDLEAKMRLPMLERKETFVCAFGKINFKKGATTRKWNLDALDQICAEKPEIKENIWAFRSEKVGEPSITVTLKE